MHSTPLHTETTFPVCIKCLIFLAHSSVLAFRNSWVLLKVVWMKHPFPFLMNDTAATSTPSVHRDDAARKLPLLFINHNSLTWFAHFGKSDLAGKILQTDLTSSRKNGLGGGKRVVPRLRELVLRGQKEFGLGGGIHTT